jgi:hypothetical protein
MIGCECDLRMTEHCSCGWLQTLDTFTSSGMYSQNVPNIRNTSGCTSRLQSELHPSKASPQCGVKLALGEYNPQTALREQFLPIVPSTILSRNYVLDLAHGQ